MIESAEQDSEQLPQVHVVWPFFKSETAAIVEIHCEFGGKSLAKDLNRCGHFLFADFFVFLLFGGGLEPLPRQRAPVEVHEDVAEGFHVIPSRLLDAQMSVDAGVPGSSS